MKFIKEFIKKKERKCFTFQPNKSFYYDVGINQKRWGQLRRGKTSPTIEELRSIANYFEVEITEFF